MRRCGRQRPDDHRRLFSVRRDRIAGRVLSCATRWSPWFPSPYALGDEGPARSRRGSIALLILQNDGTLIWRNEPERPADLTLMYTVRSAPPTTGLRCCDGLHRRFPTSFQPQSNVGDSGSTPRASAVVKSPAAHQPATVRDCLPRGFVDLRHAGRSGSDLSDPSCRVAAAGAAGHGLYGSRTSACSATPRTRGCSC